MSFCRPDGDQRAGKAEDHAAVGIAQHHVVDAEAARAVGRVKSKAIEAMASTSGDHVMLLDVDVLDRVLEEFFFRWHNVLQFIVLRPVETRVL